MNRELKTLFPKGLSDEAAFALYELLQHLALACESRYFVQLRRYQAKGQADLFDPEQPWRRSPADP